MEHIVPGLWMVQTNEIREHLAKVFGVGRSGITEIRDQTLLSDGRTQEDLKVITHEAMTAYIGSDESFLRSWEITVYKARSELHPPIEIVQKKRVEEKGRFCDLCDSKAVRHKKNCPNAKSNKEKIQ